MDTSRTPWKERLPAFWLAVVLAAPFAASPAQASLIERAQPLVGPAPGEDALFQTWSVDIDARVLLSDPEKLEFSLPDGELVSLHRSASEQNSPNQFTWFADDEERTLHSAVLSVNGVKVSGVVHTPKAVYRIGSMVGGQFVKRFVASDSSCPGGLEHPRELGGRLTEPLARIDSDATAGIDVLVLYTPAAAASLGGPSAAAAEAQAGVGYLNQSFRNSEVNARASLVGTAEIATLDGPKGMGNYLTRLRRDPAVAALREQFGADVVHVLVSSAESDNEACGLAYVMLRGDTSRDMSPFAFGATDVTCDIPVVLAHEIGHNLGLNHNPDAAGVDSSQAFRPYAYGHVTLVILGPGNAVSFKTVMAYGPRNRDVPYFSNPDVAVDTVPTGIADERDNARTLLESAFVGQGFFGKASANGPLSPSNLIIEVVGSDSVKATWQDNSSDETGFVVEGLDTTAGSGFSDLSLTPNNVTSTTITDLEPGHTWQFRARSRRNQQRSTPSNTVTVDLPAGVLPPSALTAEPTGSSSVTLNWEAGLITDELGVLTILGKRPGEAWHVMAVLNDYSSSLPGALVIDGLAADTPYSFQAVVEQGGSTLEGGVASATTSGASGPCGGGDGSLCLHSGRFEIRVVWENQHANGEVGTGHALLIPGSEQSGFFWFFGPTNIELVVKLLDARVINDFFWHAFGALSDVEYWISLRDIQTGRSRTYHNNPGDICGLFDSRAFFDDPASPSTTPPVGTAALPAKGLETASSVSPLSPNTQAAGTCSPSSTTLCLGDGRFAVDVAWNNQHQPGDTGFGFPLPDLSTSDTGFFWFFNKENIELAVKILDARTINGKFWVFWGALTDVEYTITITDTTTAASVAYHNEPFNICGGADTSAL